MFGRVPESIEVARPLKTGSSQIMRSPKPFFRTCSSVQRIAMRIFRPRVSWSQFRSE
jgi:hypothetical protein